MVCVHENMVDSSTAAETKVTKEHKKTRRKREKTRAQKDAHNANCRRHRQNAKDRRENLEAENERMKAEMEKMKAGNERMKAEFEKMKAGNERMKAGNERMKAENERMKAENERLKAKQGIEIESQELRRALEIVVPLCLIAGHESPVMFDAPNNHDTINNLSTHDPAAGFPSASAAGSSSCDIGGLFPHDPAAENKGFQNPIFKGILEMVSISSSPPQADMRYFSMQKEAIVELLKQFPRASEVDGTNFISFEEAETWILAQTYDQGPNDTNNNTTASAAVSPSCVANHGLPNNPDNNPFSHDPAAGFAAASSFLVAYPELAFAFAALYNPSNSDLFTDHDLAAEFPTSSAAGSSLVAGHESRVMFDAPNNHDTINNLSTHDPAAGNESGFPGASAAGSSSCDIGGLFPHDSAAENKAGFPKSHL